MANLVKLAAGAYSTVWGTSAFGASDLNSLANGSTMFSSLTSFDNTANLDLMADVNLIATISSNTLLVGAAVYVYLGVIDQAAAFEDNAFTPGTALAKLPGMANVGTIAFTITGSAQTTIKGSAKGIALPRKKFVWGINNACGFTLSSGQMYFDTTVYNNNA